MFRYIYRQRRRILVGTLAILFATVVEYYEEGGMDAMISEPEWADILGLSLAILFFSVTIATGISLYLLVFRRLRFLVEFISFVILIFAIWPPIAHNFFNLEVGGWLIYRPSFIIPFIFLILLYTPLLDASPIRGSRNATRKFSSPKSAEEIWFELAPGKVPAEQHWDKLLREIEPADNDPVSYEAKYAHFRGLYQLTTIKYTATEPFTHFKYNFSGKVLPRYAGAQNGTFEVTIQPKEKGGCDVTLSLYQKSLFIREAYNLWLDDNLGSQADLLYALHNQKRDWSLEGSYRRRVLKQF